MNTENTTEKNTNYTRRYKAEIWKILIILNAIKGVKNPENKLKRSGKPEHDKAAGWLSVREGRYDKPSTPVTQDNWAPWGQQADYAGPLVTRRRPSGTRADQARSECGACTQTRLRGRCTALPWIATVRVMKILIRCSLMVHCHPNVSPLEYIYTLIGEPLPNRISNRQLGFSIKRGNCIKAFTFFSSFLWH